MKKNLKIAIFWWSHLGDSIIITPLLKNLKLKDEWCYIYYMTSDDIWQYQTKNIPYIDKLAIKNKGKIIWRMKSYMDLIFWGYDYIIFDYTFYWFSLLIKRIICLMTPFSKHIVFEKKWNSKYFDKTIDLWNNNLKVSDQYKEIIEYIYQDSNNFDKEIEIFIDYKKGMETVYKILQKFNLKKDSKNIIWIFLWWRDEVYSPNWIIHRSWSENNWIKVIKFLCDRDYKVFLIWWKDNCESANCIMKNINNKNLYDLTWNLTIEQTTAFISLITLFVCTDAGPVYIAMWFNKKIVSLFCTNALNVDEYITNPLRNQSASMISYTEVITEIKKALNLR